MLSPSKHEERALPSRPGKRTLRQSLAAASCDQGEAARVSARLLVIPGRAQRGEGNPGLSTRAAFTTWIPAGLRFAWRSVG